MVEEALRPDRQYARAPGFTSAWTVPGSPIGAIAEDTASVSVYDLAFIAPLGIAEGDLVRTVGGVWTFGLRRVQDRWPIESLLSEQAIQSPWIND